MRSLLILAFLAGCSLPASYQHGMIRLDARHVAQWSNAQLLFVTRHEQAHRRHWLRGHEGELAADCYAAGKVRVTRAEFDAIAAWPFATASHPTPARRWMEIKRCMAGAR